MDASPIRPLDREPNAGEVLDIVAVAEQYWLLTGWARVAESRRWGYLEGALADGRIFTRVIANQFNADAFDHHEGFGWSGFVINLTRHWPYVQGETVRFLCMKSGELLFEYDVPDVAIPAPIPTPEKMDVRDFLSARGPPAVDFDLRRLQLYAEAFAASAGKEEFVRRAYWYILNRHADEEGIRSYVGLMARGTSPLSVLKALYDSDERKKTPGLSLVEPGDRCFPFHPE